MSNGEFLLTLANQSLPTLKENLLLTVILYFCWFWHFLLQKVTVNNFSMTQLNSRWLWFITCKFVLCFLKLLRGVLLDSRLQEAAGGWKFNFASNFVGIFSFFISALFLSLILQQPVQILDISFLSYHQFCQERIWLEIWTSKKPPFVVLMLRDWVK